MEAAPQLLSHTTSLLRQIQEGEAGASDELFAMLYGELREIARREVGSAADTLQPTALVNEIWLRLRGIDGVRLESRQHFLLVAARAMRAVLVDHARRRLTQKRGAGHRRLVLDDALDAWNRDGTIDPLILDEALSGLREQDERLADVVELRFFAGLSEEEVADALGRSRRQVQHGWRLARAWLQRELSRGARE